MLQITENKDEVIVREIPVVQWIQSFIMINIFLLIGFFWVLTAAGFVSNAVWSFGFIVPIGAFILAMLLNPSITTKIDRPGKIISVKKQSLIKYSFNVYSFNEIEDLIYVDQTDASRGNVN